MVYETQRKPVYKRAGIELQQPIDGLIARATLRALLVQPEWLREHVLFGRSGLSVLLQKVLYRFMGERRMVLIRYIEGPVSGALLWSWTDEKYLFVGSGIERKVGSVLRQLAKPGSMVYDIGANAGFWVLGLSAMVGPEGRVFAFEPSKETFERLSENLRLNERKNITAVNLGASDMEGSACFRDAGSYSHVVLDPGRRPSPGNVESVVRLIPLDEFVGLNSPAAPSLVLIDVEGHAGHVLRGAERLLRTTHPEIVCEIHHADENREVLAATSPYGYEVLPIDSASKFPRRVRLAPIRP